MVTSTLDRETPSANQLVSNDQLSPERKRSLGYRLYKALRFWVVLAAVVGVIFLSGASVFSVKTGSMRPTYQPGDLVIAVNPDVVSPEVGRVVVATPKVTGKELPAIAHRVIRQNSDGTWTTKGDYNPEPDSWRDSPQDIQKVVIAHVPMGWVKSPLIIAAGLGAIALIFMWPSKKKDDSEEGVEADEQEAANDQQRG